MCHVHTQCTIRGTGNIRWERLTLQLWLLCNLRHLDTRLSRRCLDLSGRRFIWAWNNSSAHPPATFSGPTAMTLPSQLGSVHLKAKYLFPHEVCSVWSLIFDPWKHLWSRKIECWEKVRNWAENEQTLKLQFSFIYAFLIIYVHIIFILPRILFHFEYHVS